MYPSPSIQGACAFPFQSIENDPLRECPSHVDLPTFLMSIGEKNPSAASSPSVSPLPETEPEVSHPTVSFQLYFDGTINWEARNSIPFVKATEEDERAAFPESLNDVDNPERITNTNRHTEDGWILWKYNATEPNQETVLFTMGGPIFKKNDVVIDTVSGLKICCNAEHADQASNAWSYIPYSPEDEQIDYGYTREPDLKLNTCSSDESEGSKSEEGSSENDTSTQEPNATPEYVCSCYSEIKQAYDLGDIEPTGFYLERQPIWKAKTGNSSTALLFSTGAVEDGLDLGTDPLSVSHELGQVHSKMDLAFWAWWCYENPTRKNKEEFKNLYRGMEIRYKPMS